MIRYGTRVVIIALTQMRGLDDLERKEDVEHARLKVASRKFGNREYEDHRMGL